MAMIEGTNLEGKRMLRRRNLDDLPVGIGCMSKISADLMGFSTFE